MRVAAESANGGEVSVNGGYTRLHSSGMLSCVKGICRLLIRAVLGYEFLRYRYGTPGGKFDERTDLFRPRYDSVADGEFSHDCSSHGSHVAHPHNGVKFVEELDRAMIVNGGLDDNRGNILLHEMVQRQVGLQHFGAEIFQPAHVDDIADDARKVNIIRTDWNV